MDTVVKHDKTWLNPAKNILPIQFSKRRWEETAGT